jgi:hypothetical protein
MMEAVCSYESSVNAYQIALRHTPDDITRHG